jgi:hypothetical protein
MECPKLRFRFVHIAFEAFIPFNTVTSAALIFLKKKTHVRDQPQLNEQKSTDNKNEIEGINKTASQPFYNLFRILMLMSIGETSNAVLRSLPVVR